MPSTADVIHGIYSVATPLPQFENGLSKRYYPSALNETSITLDVCIFRLVYRWTSITKGTLHLTDGKYFSGHGVLTILRMGQSIPPLSCPVFSFTSFLSSKSMQKDYFNRLKATKNLNPSWSKLHANGGIYYVFLVLCILPFWISMFLSIFLLWKISTNKTSTVAVLRFCFLGGGGNLVICLRATDCNWLTSFPGWSHLYMFSYAKLRLPAALIYPIHAPNYSG